MRHAGAALLFTLLATMARAAPDPFATAEAHLAAEDYEAILFDLADADRLPAERVARTFSRAAALSFQKEDRGMAGLYCEMALKRQPKEPTALRVCLRVAVIEGRTEEAQRWGEALAEQLPKDAEVALLRAKAERERGRWGAIVALLEAHQGDKSFGAEARTLLDEARKAREDQAALGRQEAELARNLEAALKQARASETRDSEGAVGASEQHAGVTLYSTSWCGACRGAAKWLRSRSIDFVEKDIEKDPGAQREMMSRCVKAGVRPRGVPVIFVGDEPVLGFMIERLEELLGPGGGRR